jgi:hypothetical protein
MRSMSMSLRLRWANSPDLDGRWTQAERACNKSLQALEIVWLRGLATIWIWSFPGPWRNYLPRVEPRKS